MPRSECLRGDDVGSDDASKPSPAVHGGVRRGVLGAYLVLFPRKRVRVLTVFGVSTVPAVLMLGLWILIQLASGLGSMGQTGEAGGIAYAAHVAGFVAGILLTVLLGTRRRRWAGARPRSKPDRGGRVVRT